MVESTLVRIYVSISVSCIKGNYGTTPDFIVVYGLVGCFLFFLCILGYGN